MIHEELVGAPGPRERWAFATLIDQARVLVADAAAADAVQARWDPAELAFGVAHGAVTVGPGVLGPILEVAGTEAEYASPLRDQHGRVPSRANPQVVRGLERSLPGASRTADLWQALQRAAGPRPLRRVAAWPAGHSWAVALSHDLDIVTGWPLFAAARWLELLRKGEGRRAVEAVRAGLGALGQQPVRRGVHRLLGAEERFGFRSTWFVLAGHPSLGTWLRGDVTYRAEAPGTVALIDSIRRGGHEIGLHGSFATRESTDAFAVERSRIAAITGSPPVGVRQHFLRLTPGRTLRAARIAGFEYDSTLGFADRGGFRLGTADVLAAWDPERLEPVGLDEVPLVWMDRALSKYQRLEDPNRWVADALDLAATCRQAGGLWVGLWHPNVVPALGFPGADLAFEQLLAGLGEADPFVGTLGEMVAWRRARRGLRGSVLPDGRTVLSEAGPGRWAATVQDEAGRLQPSVIWSEARDG